MTLPPITRTTHTLPFDKLSPRDFERLCLWLVEREGYERAGHIPNPPSPCRCCQIMVKYLLEVSRGVP